jgi:hypothetical protein
VAERSWLNPALLDESHDVDLLQTEHAAKPVGGERAFVDEPVQGACRDPQLLGGGSQVISSPDSAGEALTAAIRASGGLGIKVAHPLVEKFEGAPGGVVATLSSLQRGELLVAAGWVRVDGDDAFQDPDGGVDVAVLFETGGARGEVVEGAASEVVSGCFGPGVELAVEEVASIQLRDSITAVRCLV